MAKLRVDKIAAPIVKDEFTGSVFFDGNGDHLDVPLSDDFQFGAGDFNIEAWVYLVEAKDQAIFGTNNSADPNYEGYELDVFTNGSVRFYSGNGSAYNYGALGLESSAGVVPQQTWTHLALSRQGNTLRLFVNGVFSVSNTSFSHTIENSAVAPDIGNDGRSTGTSYHTHGYISNFRICKGHAVYTENFTPPTRELEVHLGAKGVVFPAADNRTVLLACQSSTDATAEATGRHTLTANGNATAADANPGLFRRTLNLTTVTENTGSVYFDGSTDYLKDSVSSADFSYGTGDFTIEYWIYPTALNTVNTIVANWDLSYTANEWGTYLHSSNKIKVDTGTANVLTSTTSVNLHEWTHVVYTRQNGTHKLYINGVLDVSSTTAYDFSEVNTLAIGAYSNAGENPFTGYISNLRICKGHAVYKSNFAPPTTELEVHEGPEDDRTVLLACYDGENIFADKSGRHVIAAYGDRLSSPTPTATDSPIGITTNYPPVTRNVDPTAGPTFQGGVGFVSQNWLTLPKGTTTERNRTGGRGIFMGGYTNSPSNAALADINYITISSMGNSFDFGDLVNAARWAGGSCGSSTKGLYGGGAVPSSTDHIDYVTIATTGDAMDFGNLDTAQGYVKACSNQIRGIWGGGRTSPSASSNVIQYITIATIGDAIDFGDLTSARTGLAALSSPTRGIFSGGYTHPSPTTLNTIDYVTIATTGQAKDFGDLYLAVKYSDAASSGTRGVIGGGSSPVTSQIQYVTISSKGNALDFGGLTSSLEHISGTDNSIRGVFGGGAYVNTMQYITIATTGNAQDFGDLIKKTGYAGGTSDSHGGLG